MASVITSRRASDPTLLEIEARKAEIHAARGWVAPETDYISEVNGLLLEQIDEAEDYRDPRQVEEWLPVPKAPQPGEPREMTREDICNIDLRSLFSLNIIPEPLPDRYTLGVIDPELVDLSPDSLADHLEANARPLPLLKTEIQSNRELQQREVSEPVDLEIGPREMTKTDICNVEFINSRDLDDVFDGIIEAASFQHALEDCECRWNIADVDHDLMDLSDRAMLAIHDQLSLDVDERGTPQEMSKADRCNVDVSSLLALNTGVEGVLDLERWAVGDVDPEVEDVSDAATYERLEASSRPIPMALKTETHRDVVAFRSKRK